VAGPGLWRASLRCLALRVVAGSGSRDLEWESWVWQRPSPLCGLVSGADSSSWAGVTSGIVC